VTAKREHVRRRQQAAVVLYLPTCHLVFFASILSSNCHQYQHLFIVSNLRRLGARTPAAFRDLGATDFRTGRAWLRWRLNLCHGGHDISPDLLDGDRQRLCAWWLMERTVPTNGRNRAGALSIGSNNVLRVGEQVAGVAWRP